MLKLPRKLHNQYMGPFEVLKQAAPTAYKLNLIHSSVLKIIHPDFYVSLLRDFEGLWNNGLK